MRITTPLVRGALGAPFLPVLVTLLLACGDFPTQVLDLEVRGDTETKSLPELPLPFASEEIEAMVETFDWAETVALPVLDEVFWGGDFEALRRAIADGYADPERIRFFVGYSGWGPGQLDAEVDELSWIVRPGTAALVFADGDDALWRQVLRQLGGEYALLSTFPDDPRLN